MSSTSFCFITGRLMSTSASNLSCFLLFSSFSHAVFTVAINSSLSIGLSRYLKTPASNALFAYSKSLYPDSIIVIPSKFSSCNVFTISTPLITGILTSLITTSGFNARIFSSPSFPFTAVATTSTPCSFQSTVSVIPSLTRYSSSTTIILYIAFRSDLIRLF